MPAEPEQRERAINAPGVVIGLIGILTLIQIAREFISIRDDNYLLGLFAFWPARYDATLPTNYLLPGGVWAEVWGFLSYAFLHGGWTHLILNAVWLLAFGSAVAWRFGAMRFLALSAIGAIAGAATHLYFHWGEMTPVIGASAAISAQMAAAIRFVFQPGAPLGLFRVGGPAAFRVPALSLGRALRDQRVVMFLVFWFGVNIVTGIGSSVLSDGDTIAWEAHIGGFLAGLLLFPLFDPGMRRGD